MTAPARRRGRGRACRAGAAAAAVLCAALLAAGCGSRDDLASFPPAAGPARSPAATTPPEGRTVRVGAPVQALTMDPRTGVLAVALAHELVLVDGRTLRILRRLPRHAAADRQLPRPRGTARLDDGTEAVLAPRRRTLALRDPGGRTTIAAVPAGIGPTDVVAGAGGRLYVIDTGGGSVLYVRTRPSLKLVRRAAAPGGPYATALDRERGKLWVTLTARNEVVQLTADGAPRIQRRFPTVRQPNAIAIDDATGTVYVASANDGTLQAFPGYPAR